MAEIPIVIDTNLWIELTLVLGRLNKRTGKSYKELWSTFNNDLTIEEQGSFRGTTNFMERLLEMKKSSSEYVVHVPSFVYNEAARKVSSKISSQTEGNEKFVQTFKEILESLPVKYILFDEILKEDIDYPKKSEIEGKSLEETMKDFLKKKQQPTLIQLIEHLRDPDKAKIKVVQERTQILKKRMTDVLQKNQKWDQPMTEASKIHGFPYEPRTKALSSLYGSVGKYRDVSKIPFKPDPLNVITERLTMVGEEFDFFDLQIYLYAKEKNAHIITKNTQAYQEINDPCFLGYFKDVKIMHPSINFDSLEDLNSSGDLNEIIDRSIKKDFNELDLSICRELDSKLNEPILENKGGKLIRDTESNYSPDVKRLKIDTSLGAVLKVLRIENKNLKVSRQYFFEDNKQVKILQFIDKEFFNNQLTSGDFVKDLKSIDKVRKNFFKYKTLTEFLNNNPRIKDKLAQFQSSPGNYLDQFLEMYRGKSDGEVGKWFLALSIESHFSESEIEEGLKVRPDLETLSLRSCPPSGHVRKREESRCMLKWEEIEKFNNEKVQKRDPLKVKIDSQKFLNYLKTIEDPTERKQLIDFADQVLNSAEDHTSKISGPKVLEVTQLINNRKVLNHFSKVHYISSALNYGMFAKHLLVDLFEGNIEGVAINIGFMAGNYGLSKLAATSLAKGGKFAKEGKLILGNSLKFASPFISRFLSPLIALDLYNQIKAFQAGDEDALVGIVGDSIFLIIDVVDIGVWLLEIAGVISGVSAVTGPIGMAIGAIVMVGVDIYYTVRKVQKIDEIIHLTTVERWEIGLGSFFGIGSTNTVLQSLIPVLSFMPEELLSKINYERLAEIKAANNQMAQQAMEAIRKNPGIQRIVIPSARRREDNTIEIAQHNSFVSYNNATNIKWRRDRPVDPEGGRIFCAPEGDWENPYHRIMAKCWNAIGITDLTRKTQNYTLFNLGDGQDVVEGFKDSPNIFHVGKGTKMLDGGNKNDIFILEEGTTFNDFPRGYVNGRGGSNILNFGGITLENNEPVVIMFEEEPVVAKIMQLINLERQEYRKNDMYFYNIDSVIGRENESDFIHTNCTTKYVDGRGGSSADHADYIFISHTKKYCIHDKVIQLGPNTVALNEAITGKFSYFVKDVYSVIKCVLKRSTPYNTLVTENNHIEHKFFLNSTFSDIAMFEFYHDKGDSYNIIIKIHFIDKNKKKGRFDIETILGYGKNNGGMDNLEIYFKDNVVLRYHHNGIYALLKSNESVLDIIRKYKPLAVYHDISIFIYAEKEGAMVSIGSDKKDDVLYNDPSHKTYLMGNRGNNTYIILSGRDFLQGPDPPIIPKIEVYSSDGQNDINVLDLHLISQQIKEDLGKELLIKHVFDSQKLVLYLYTMGEQAIGSLSYNNVTSITFRNIPTPSKLDSWCNRLRILLNTAPVVLKCDQNYHDKFGNTIDYNRDVKNYDHSNYYTPLPLEFSNYEIVIISREDVEPFTEVIVKHKLGRFRFLRLEDDLILTNGFDFETPAYRPTTVMIKNFYKDPSVFYTLKFKFNDNMISFKSQKKNIEEAKALEDWYDEYNKISNNIIGNHSLRSKRDLGTPEDLLNKSEFVQSQSKGIFGTITQSLSNIYYKSLDSIYDYVKHVVSPTHKPVFERLQNPKFDFPNKHGIENEGISGSKPNVIDENKITYSDVNSTLLLLDTLIRKLNDFNYNLPIEDYLLSPHEHLEKKMAELTNKLGLDLDDIEGSLEKQQQRMLEKLAG